MGRKTIWKEQPRLKTLFKGVKTRCFYEKHEAFHRYGGRGITICKEWLDDPAIFLKWAISNGYRDDLTLDRIDNDGHYEPGNCRWVTRAEQSHNRGDNRFTLESAAAIRARYRAGGVTYRQLAAEYGAAVSGIFKIVNGQSWKPE